MGEIRIKLRSSRVQAALFRQDFLKTNGAIFNTQTNLTQTNLLRGGRQRKTRQRFQMNCTACTIAFLAGDVFVRTLVASPILMVHHLNLPKYLNNGLLISEGRYA